MDFSTAKPKPLNCIWDDPNITKNAKSWTCNWCKTVFQGYNSYRAVAHVSRIKIYNNSGAAFCNANIPQEIMVVYEEFANCINTKRPKKETAQFVHVASAELNNKNIANMVTKKKCKASGFLV